MVSIPDPLAVAEFGELCRLCGAKTSVLMGFHIFEREGSLREIYKKIKACLPIEVTTEDKLPKMVCEECVYKLDALYDFREKSVKTEYILNSMMKGLYAAPPCNQQFSPPHSHSLDDLMCASNLHPADALHSTDAIHSADTIHSADAIHLRSQVEVDLTNSANHIDNMIVSLPIVSSSGNIKCEGELGELKAKTESLIARSVEGDTNDSLVTVPDVDHSSDNCTITEHIVNNIQVADVRSLQNITATDLKGDGTDQGRHFLMATHTEQPWFFCDICGKPFGDSNEFQAHCEIHWKKCQLCGVTCANDDALMLHLRESHNTTLQQLQNHQPPHQQQHQSQQQQQAQQQQQHQQQQQQQQQTQLQQQLVSVDHSPEATQLSEDTDFQSQAPDPVPGSSDPLNGPINPKPSEESHEMAQPGVESHDPEKLDVKSEAKLGSKTCNECGKEYRTNYKLAEHMRKHTGEKPFKCSMCEKTFRSKIGLAQHEARHTGHYDYTCSTCGKGFQCKSYLIVHQRVHSDLKPYPCETCGRPFKTKQSLLDHQNRHLGVKPYICDVCGRGFITKGLCKSHQKVHSGTDNRQYPCSVCSKLFVSKSYLATHMRIHTGEKPFMCEVCGKGFLTRVDLKIHSTMHTGEKSFVCEVCGKAFARRDALRCHKRSHTGERPYKCDICGQGFTQFSPMAIHKRLHTGERPYACDICSKTFVSRSTMMSHRKKHVGS